MSSPASPAWVVELETQTEDRQKTDSQEKKTKKNKPGSAGCNTKNSGKAAPTALRDRQHVRSTTTHLSRFERHKTLGGVDLSNHE